MAFASAGSRKEFDTSDWQMNVEAEEDHQDYHQLRRCIELQIEMHRAPIRAKHPSHHPDCPLHGTLAHC